MNLEDKKILQDIVSQQFKLRDDARKQVINDNFQLLMNQFDLFKTIATIVVALSAISYFYEKDLNEWSLTMAFIFGLATLLVSIS